MTGLSGSAMAALGVQAPSPSPERIAWVTIESAPQMVAILDPADASVLGHYAQFDESLGLTDPMADKARAVIDDFDGARCEGNGCEGLIGFYLAGDADEQTRWKWTTLIQRGRKVIAVCEDCSPDVLYMDLWETTP